MSIFSFRKPLCIGFHIFLVSIILSSCGHSNHPIRSIDGALTLCQERLDELKEEKKMSIEELVLNINDIRTYEDSIISFSSRDTSRIVSKKRQLRIISLSDSLRREILRLALSEERSPADVVYLRLNAPAGMSEEIDQKILKQANRFFAKLDNNSTLKDVNITLKEYDRVLSNEGYMHITSREIFKDFLKKEDICFRSMLKFLPSIPGSRMAKISRKTSLLCSAFYAPDGVSFAPLNEIALYMTVRYNRRILQNADVCRSHIISGAKLSKEKADAYEWMLLQPLFQIDNMSALALSSAQKQQLQDLMQDLPEVLEKLYQTDRKQHEKSDVVMRNIAAHLIKSHIKKVI